jgi:DNA-binding NarL/FixJ family response regulator
MASSDRPASSPTLVVVDPHPVIRDGLPLLLKDEALVVVAAGGTGAVGQTLVERHAPTVMLLADPLPDMSASALVARLVRRGSRTAVVLLIDGDERPAIQGALSSGAAGVVSSRRPVAQLSRALRTVAAGGTWFGESDWVEAPLSEAARRSVPRTEDLSTSERRVLALVAAGAATEEIAAALEVSPHTVRTHVRNLLRKLDAQSRAHAVAIAMRDSALDL